MTATIKSAPNETSEADMPVNNLRDPNFPAPLEKEAFYGIIGEIVKAIEPHTEADPAAMLLMLLTGCGSALGRGVYYMADGARHGTNLFTCIVADSSKGRKGTAWARVKTSITEAAGGAFENRIAGGLSSGEGLINLVRDGDGKDDPGVADKRLLVVQSEFSSPLKMMLRQGNNLSEIIREAWDGGKLQTATKNSPLVATTSHIAIIGHITGEELARSISDTEAANGFGNRILWGAARRSKCLPFGGSPDDATMNALVIKLRAAFTKGKVNKRYYFNTEAREVWAAVYPDLSDGKPGLLGSMINRAEAQVIRIALNYAALDTADGFIRPEHLNAALAVWDYCEASARWIFGERLGDPVADSILVALIARPNGMTRTEISAHLGRNIKADRIDTALQFLAGHDKAMFKCDVGTGGRSAERWFAITKETKETN